MFFTHSRGSTQRKQGQQEPREGAELLLGYLEVSARVPRNTAKVQPSQQSTVLTLE